MKNYIRLLFLAIVIVVVGLIYPKQIAYACTCAPIGGAQEELVNSAYVFQGKVTSVIPIGVSSYSVSFDVIKVWKGIGYKSITLNEVYCSAYPTPSFMKIGKEYIVYAKGDTPNLTFGMCSRIVESRHINDEVKELGEGARPTINYPIYLRQDYWIFSALIFAVFIFTSSVIFIKKKKHGQNFR